MTKDRFVVNPFPELVLTPEDHEELKLLANGCIQSHLERYNEYVGVYNRRVDAQHWKKIKERQNIGMYVEKPGASTTASELTGGGLPMLLCVGPMVGHLDDLMFGILNPTLEAMRIKASYLDDFNGAAVLGPIVQPSLDQPFQSLVVKWMEVAIPFSSTTLTKNRDYVYVEATGFVTAADGERLAYHVLHSVNFPTTPSLPNRVRAHMSAVCFWRQQNSNSMETFGTCVMDPAGDMVKSLAVAAMGKAFMAGVKYVYCGQMKKLSWMLEKRYAEAKEHGTPNKGNECVTCSAVIKSRRLGDFGKSDSSCKLCFGHVCYACKITRKLSFVTADLQLEQRKVTFCAACIAEATSSSATAAAQAHVMYGKNFKHRDVSSIGTSSCSSSTSGSVRC